MKLFCCECKDEILKCDGCGEDFEEDDEIVCHSFNHFHINCNLDETAFAVSEENRFEY
jgi:hypothetical protein